jgi:hypothetical protein
MSTSRVAGLGYLACRVSCSSPQTDPDQGARHCNVDEQQSLPHYRKMEDHRHKRASAGDGGPPEKRLKGEPEDTEVYSQRIKKKLQANSRTGQACDRCKVGSQNITSLPPQLFTSRALTFSSPPVGKEDEVRLRPGRLPAMPIQKSSLRRDR